MERRLKRGLEALMGKGGVQVAASQASIQSVPVSSIHPNPRQPRKEFNETALKELQESIAQDGLLQPIVVRRTETGYEIIAGERRWRACRSLGHPRIPAMIRSVEHDEQLVLALVENLQRSDLNAIDEARAFRRLLDEFSLTHDQVAQRVGRERSTVTNVLRLLDLPEPIRVEVSRGTISAGHGRALLPLVGRKELDEVFEAIVESGASVRETERLVREILQGPGSTAQTRKPRHSPKRPPALEDLEDRIRGHWGVPTRIQMTRRGGSVTFQCSSHEEFEDLVARFESAQWDRSARGHKTTDEFPV